MQGVYETLNVLLRDTVLKQAAALPLSILQIIPLPCLSQLIYNFSIRLSINGVPLTDQNINSFQRNVFLWHVKAPTLNKTHCLFRLFRLSAQWMRYVARNIRHISRHVWLWNLRGRGSYISQKTSVFGTAAPVKIYCVITTDSVVYGLKNVLYDNNR
jgi:hypothetical protein